MQTIYPSKKTLDSTNTYFGVQVKDPNRWLEYHRSKDTEVWAKSRNETTFKYLNNILFKNAHKNQFSKLWNYEKISVPYSEGKYPYFSKKNELQNQNVIYRTKGSALLAKTNQHKVYCYKLAHPHIIYGKNYQEKHRYIYKNITEYDRYLIIKPQILASNNKLLIKYLTVKNSPFITLLNPTDNDTYVIENAGSLLYLVTNFNALN